MIFFSCCKFPIIAK